MGRDLTLEKVLRNIEVNAQYTLAILWIETAFPIWEEYCKINPNDLSFYDGVGNFYQIEKEILVKSIEAVKVERSHPGTQLSQIEELYDSIHTYIISIDRWDWDPPESVNRTFCSVFNLLQLFTKSFDQAKEEAQLNLVINQAADALLNGKVKTLEGLNHELSAVLFSNRKRTDESDRSAS